MRLVALSFASLFALSGLTGCNTDKFGDWGQIGTRDDQAEQPPPASRGKEVIELCKQVKLAQSPLCNDMDQLNKKKPAH